MRCYITNGKVGSENTLVRDYDLSSWQGIKQARYWVAYLENQTGLPCWVENRFREQLLGI